MPPTDHDTKERLERAQVCLEALCPPSERAHRAELTSAAIGEMVEYRDYLAAVDATEPACDALRSRLADRYRRGREIRVRRLHVAAYVEHPHHQRIIAVQ